MTAVNPMSSKVIASFMNAKAPRTVFDPASPSHRVAYHNFLRTGKWDDGCPFKLEWPFLTIPAQCERRLLDFYITRDSDLHK